MSQVLTEITKCEPTFEINEFLIRVQNDIIPNILESLSQNELEILKDWCTEAVCNFYDKEYYFYRQTREKGIETISFKSNFKKP